MSLTGSARSDGQIAANLRDAAVLRAAATGGVETAIVSMVVDRPVDPPGQIVIDDAIVMATSESLAGDVNSNLAPVPLLRALLIHVWVEPAPAEAAPCRTSMPSFASVPASTRGRSWPGAAVFDQRRA